MKASDNKPSVRDPFNGFVDEDRPVPSNVRRRSLEAHQVNKPDIRPSIDRVEYTGWNEASSSQTGASSSHTGASSSQTGASKSSRFRRRSNSFPSATSRRSNVPVQAKPGSRNAPLSSKWRHNKVVPLPRRTYANTFLRRNFENHEYQSRDVAVNNFSEYGFMGMELRRKYPPPYPRLVHVGDNIYESTTERSRGNVPKTMRQRIKYCLRELLYALPIILLFIGGHVLIVWLFFTFNYCYYRYQGSPTYVEVQDYILGHLGYLPLPLCEMLASFRKMSLPEFIEDIVVTVPIVGLLICCYGSFLIWIKWRKRKRRIQPQNI